MKNIEADAIVDNIKEAFVVHPKGIHFCTLTKQSGYALNTEDLIKVFNDRERFQVKYVRAIQALKDASFYLDNPPTLEEKIKELESI